MEDLKVDDDENEIREEKSTNTCAIICMIDDQFVWSNSSILGMSQLHEHHLVDKTVMNKANSLKAYIWYLTKIRPQIDFLFIPLKLESLECKKSNWERITSTIYITSSYQ